MPLPPHPHAPNGPYGPFGTFEVGGAAARTTPATVTASSSASWPPPSWADWDWEEAAANATAWPTRAANDSLLDGLQAGHNNWWALLALFLVVATAAGNILVCLAITWERRLQNVTNYFLMSLAITDLMVAVLVMPLGILTLVKGQFPRRERGGERPRSGGQAARRTRPRGGRPTLRSAGAPRARAVQAPGRSQRRICRIAKRDVARGAEPSIAF
ncbi:hypothetical protein ONE63_006888 [Megalurothrips usitatus]|uniref:G-protein coupled receptors family 1 profile domain-containing protein n=1 Tax=Megalurothrips usitatus TaxID=439358 RepID=A0AAV7XX87_9NEOP|nr:hypothetical protein ONE63_006888 [Megalurothrips usitatus]